MLLLGSLHCEILRKSGCQLQSCNEDWKWTEYEDEDSSDSGNGPKTNTKILRQFKKSLKIFEDFKFFEYLRRCEDFSRGVEKFCHLKTSLCLSLEHNFTNEKQNLHGNYSYKFSSNEYIFWNLLDIFFQKNVNYSQKSSESLASNLRSFEDSLTFRKGPKTKMDLWTKIFEDRRSSKLRCNSGTHPVDD